jgi:hypothetical protein
MINENGPIPKEIDEQTFPAPPVMTTPMRYIQAPLDVLFCIGLRFQRECHSLAMEEMMACEFSKI